MFKCTISLAATHHIVFNLPRAHGTLVVTYLSRSHWINVDQNTPASFWQVHISIQMLLLTICFHVLTQHRLWFVDEKNSRLLPIDPTKVRTDSASRWRSLESPLDQEILYPDDSKLTNHLQNQLTYTVPRWEEIMVQMDMALPVPKRTVKSNQSKTEENSHRTTGARATSRKCWFVLYNYSIKSL